MRTIKFNELIAEKNLSHGWTSPSKIYTGKESGCRCGCRGNYWEADSVGFKRAFNKIKKINPDVLLFNDSDELNKWVSEVCPSWSCTLQQPGTCFAMEYDNSVWIDLVLPNDRTITVYFEDV